MDDYPSGYATSVGQYHGTISQEVDQCLHKHVDYCFVALIEARASHHMLSNNTLFGKGSVVQGPSGSPAHLAGGGATLPVKGIQRADIKAPDGSNFTLDECLLVPKPSKQSYFRWEID